MGRILRGESAKRGAAVVVALAAIFLFLASAASSSQDESESSAPGKIEFTGKNLIATAEGTFHEWRVVAFAVDPERLEQSWALVEIDLASVDTGIKRRDDHLRDPDFFEVSTYPTARVRGHSLVAAGENEAGQPRYKASFDVDLHGVQKTIEGEVLVTRGEKIRFEGSLVVDRTDFGVGPPIGSRWNLMAVKAPIPVRFSFELAGGESSDG